MVEAEKHQLARLACLLGHCACDVCVQMDSEAALIGSHPMFLDNGLMMSIRFRSLYTLYDISNDELRREILYEIERRGAHTWNPD